MTDLSQEQVDKITTFSEKEMPIEATEIPVEELVDTKEDAQRIEDIKKTGNVEGYISKLHDMLLRIKAIEKKAEEIKDQHLQEQSTLAKEKRLLRIIRKRKKRNLNQKESGITIGKRSSTRKNGYRQWRIHHCHKKPFGFDALYRRRNNQFNQNTG